MKMFKRALSCFMAAVMALTMMCGLTVSVGAATKMTSEMYVKAENGGDGYYFIYLKGISNEDFMAAGKRAIENKGSWTAEIQFNSSDGKSGGLISLCPFFEEGTNTIYQYMPSGAYYNGKSVNLNGAFAFYDIEVNDSDYSYTRSWTVYFSVPEDIYTAFSKATEYSASFGVLVGEKSTDPYGSGVKYFDVQNKSTHTSTSASDSKKISSLKISSISDRAYTGKAIKPSVTVKDGTKTLKNGTDYTLTYKNNTKIGKATVTIKGKGSYTGEKTVSFNIVPGKPTLKVSKKSDTKATFSWDSVKGAEKYEIYYCANGGKYKKLATVSGSKKSYTSSKLDFKKNDYKFKIRAYDKVGDKTYYGAYSKIVTVK